MPNQYTNVSLQERFEGNVELIPFSTCHWWTGYGLPSGYGQIRANGKTKSAHRVSYELYKGEIPKGMLVLHDCQSKGHFEDNPSCVNPDHLFLGTQKDNMQDMSNKDRSLAGEKHPASKLTAEQVVEIRSSDLSQRKLAEKFNVSHSKISQIIRRVSWVHIP